MKPLFGLLLALATTAHADDAVPNGYGQLVAAGKLILPGENGTPATADTKLTPAEDLRRQRVAVTRNAPALAMARAALKLPILTPVAKNYADFDRQPFGSFRELARQFQQEAAVRSADGDWKGALDSRLDTIELGAAFTPGATLIGMLSGASIEGIGRRDLEKIVAHVDAPALRSALERLKAIDARRASLIDVTEVEKQTATNLTLLMFKNDKDVQIMKEKLATAEGRKEMGVSDAQATEMMGLTRDSVAAQLSAAFDAEIAIYRMTYPQARKTVLPPVKGMFVEVWFSGADTTRSRFPYERNIANERLLEGALELKALKLEKGAYPANFDAGLDPFGDGTPLIYHRDGDGYSLYSIGPDGKDDGGEEIETLETNPETGIKTVTGTVTQTSTGDISAPVF